MDFTRSLESATGVFVFTSWPSALTSFFRPDTERLALPRSAPDDHIASSAADLFVRLVLVAEAFLDRDLRSERLEAMAQVREHLRARREMAALLAEGPRDASGGEERVRLMQAHVVVCREPHAADSCSAIDDNDAVPRREVPARDEERIQTGNARAEDAEVARNLFDPGVGRRVIRAHGRPM